jgi:hypothetical protein
MRYIQRIDRNHHAWKVTLRRKKLETHHYFSDQAYGGTPQALVAAMAWRDKMAGSSQVSITPSGAASWSGPRTRRASGGFAAAAPSSEPGAEAATTGRTGRRTGHCAPRGTRTFGLNKHGEERARELALAAREEAMRQQAAIQNLQREIAPGATRSSPRPIPCFRSQAFSTTGRPACTTNRASVCTPLSARATSSTTRRVVVSVRGVSSTTP